MTATLDALPARWRDDRLVLSDRHKLAGARVLGDDEGIVVLFDGPTGLSVTGYGPDGRAVGIVTALVDAGELRAPLRWLSLPRAVDLPGPVCAALSVEPLPGWDWMSTTAVADAPGTDRVERLDLEADLPAVLDCLAAGNPTTDSDPTSPHEAGWWGVRDGDRLVGVLGAGLRGGATDDGFSWHLHGLGVRPEGRRAARSLPAWKRSAGRRDKPTLEMLFSASTRYMAVFLRSDVAVSRGGARSRS